MSGRATSRVVDAGAAPQEALAEAVATLGAGGVVAVPTDTVYGLVARIDRPAAIDAVFAVKGRPGDLALPVLVNGTGQLDAVAVSWRPLIGSLARRYWPGPLTLVVPARPDVGRLIGGDGRSVGVRHPDHPFVEALCGSAGPLASTSANRHGEPPCTTAARVQQLGLAELVVDGGTCRGAPSTVIDCTGEVLRCLRPGRVPFDEVLTAER